MTIGDNLSFHSISQVLTTVQQPDGAAALLHAPHFEVKGCRYRLTVTEQGPQVSRLGRAGLTDLLWHRLAQGQTTSHAARMTRGIDDDPVARRAILGAALAAWRDGGPQQQRAEAVRRVLECYDRGGIELDLRGLELSSLPPAIAMLNRLQVLRLGCNRLDSVPSVLRRLSSLRVLELDHNKLSVLPDWLAKLHGLEVLSVKANRLTDYPLRIASLPKLALLWLDDNRITDLPIDVAMSRRATETFVQGNPLPDGALLVQALALSAHGDAPVHIDHHVVDSAASKRFQLAFPLPGLSQGRLISFVHDVPPGAMAFEVEPAVGLPPAPAEQSRQLFAQISARLEQAPPSTRSKPIMQYRLQLLQRWLATDEALYQRCSAVLGAALSDCPAALVSALDDVELAVIEHLLASDAGQGAAGSPVGRLLAVGHGLFRLGLLYEVLAPSMRTEASPYDTVQAYRAMLAHALGLPGEVRPICAEQWSRAGMTEGRLDDVYQQVRMREAEHGGARLDRFMADWKPWREHVRRTESDRIERIHLQMQGMLERAAALRDAGELPADVFDQLAAGMPAYFEAVLRSLCREAHAACRRDGRVEERPPVIGSAAAAIGPVAALTA